MSGIAANPIHSQSFAETALTYPAASNNTHISKSVPDNTLIKPLANGLAVDVPVSVPSAAAIAPRPIPSLLRYVDNELMQSASKHNRPADPRAICTICYYLWDTPLNGIKDGLNGQTPIHSTFLPLSPCGHWAHYRCLIWLATKNIAQRDKCTVCGTQLFHWEGIAALTLATRTGLTMEDDTSCSEAAAYEKDCAAITSLIHSTFFTHLALPSPYTDRSPDLVQCFYDALDALERMGLPRAKWLRYETQTGHLLWGALVAIKMRKYLAEEHEWVMGTEGWRKFEEGRGMVQARILGEVRGVEG
ncbi:hypothetical protein DE146DRAFT_676815 [Phaeosphaeria sp. MPI-PUGE-AT-0046c]|nr:hypothetical protein DE146DRAFT_676815 [Phaeosphaeria sp. MPI-PUGE-AT-0046c]